MSAKLLCTLTGVPVFVAPESHVFGIMESTARFTEAGNDIADWPNKFVILDVYDTSAESLIYLMNGDKEDDPITVDVPAILVQTTADTTVNNTIRVSAFDLSIKFFIRG
jgi:hypothetical protein